VRGGAEPRGDRLSETCEICGGTGEYIRPELFENDPLAMGLMAMAMEDGTGQCEKDPCPACSEVKHPSPFEMSADISVLCEEFDKHAGPGKRCKQNNGTCPVNGDSSKCGSVADG